MTASGQLRSSEDVRRTTALAPKAEVHPRSCYVAQVARSRHMQRNKQRHYSITSSARASSAAGTSIAKRFCCLGRRLHGKIGGLLAFEYAVDVFGGAPDRIERVGPIGDQAAILRVITVRVDGG